jgi:hypothetical protein
MLASLRTLSNIYVTYVGIFCSQSYQNENSKKLLMDTVSISPFVVVVVAMQLGKLTIGDFLNHGPLR